jgi:hypothetical protein
MEVILFGNLNVNIDVKSIFKKFKNFTRRIFNRDEGKNTIGVVHSDLKELEDLYLENTRATDYIIINYDGERVFHSGMNAELPESDFNIFINNLREHIVENKTKNYKFTTLQKKMIYCIYTFGVKNENQDIAFYVIINKPVDVKDLNLESLLS